MIIAASFDVTDPEKWNNRALQYGDGLFETMRVCHSMIPLWSLHQSRLQKGLTRLHLKQPDWHVIESNIKQHCPGQFKQKGVVKLVVFRQSQGRTYQPKSTQVEWFLNATKFVADERNSPLNLALAKTVLIKNKSFAGIKHLNRLEQVMIASELNGVVGIDDLLVLDEKQRIIETTCQNVVLIKNHQLFTPRIKNCGVKGVGIKWLKENFDLTTTHISIKDIAEFDGMMVGNSVRGFKLVSSLLGIHSFITRQFIHDKITANWDRTFN